MFALFRRKKASQGADPLQPGPKGLILPESAAALLASPRREQLLEHIWQRTSLSREQFSSLYRMPLERYAALVQQLPASESHHHAYPGGMLDHGLEIVAYALKLRQSYLLPVGAPPETQIAQAEAWTAGVAYAALLHDVGKIAVDVHVEYGDGTRWHPWHGPLARAYRFRYRKDREYRLHGAAAGLLYADILDPPILDWLSGFPELWSALLYVLAGQHEHAGILGEIVSQADQASVAQDLGGDPAKARQAPKQALQRKLLDGLHYLIREELKLNQPQASDGWLTQDALWLVSKTVCDKLRAHLLTQGMEGIPDRNTALFDVLQDHGIAQATPGGKAIWKATVASDSGWSHSFTFLKLAPALIWETGERPASFNGTVRVEEDGGESNDATSVTEFAAPSSDSSRTVPPPSSSTPIVQADTSDAVGSVLALLDTMTPTPSESDNVPAISADPVKPADAELPPASMTTPDTSPGRHFMDWLRNGIHGRRLVINDAKALVHTVAGTAYLVSPGVFQRYAQEHPDVSRVAKQEKLANWEWVQKSFEKLRLHKKQDNGLNIWTCEVKGPRKTRRLHGYLLKDGSALMPEIPFDNPYLRLLSDASQKAQTEAA